MDLFDSRQADEIGALLALAEQGSFAGAGKTLQRHPSVLSKRILALETRLGVRLVERTTRHVRLTEVGHRYVEKLRVARQLLIEAEHEATLGAEQLTGTLRVSLPGAMGRMWLSPLIAEFMLAYPGISVEMAFSERFVDIVAEGFDVAIRIGELPDSRLLARKLCEHRRILCASPSYLVQHGVPQRPKDLEAHNCLGFTGFASYPHWHLSKQGSTESVLTHSTLKSDDNEALLGAARVGIGIVAGGDWLMTRDLAAGRLVRVLPEWTLDVNAGIYLVRPSGKFSPAKTIAFKNWMELRFAQGAPWSRALV
ncbi:LysR family transcriptional regulator [Pseudomonas sp. SZMC_28357]|uniref:LysR family transcriptional regulator n=1 Tax=Pseudomonas sp. SZMC_28357 TaxID=3074380 RepID=UPI0028711FAE|nr:LysR family transcriptional regulator [Pseudomonas sp. SZMC_28357]MDR9749940.1 LysR family transcriptional regulator [Pseudomonas sp. SZMC_28357]